MSKDLIIAMWSGPRNLSTALMRSFGNRGDVTTVLDEPFYASYLASTNKNHPLKDKVIRSQSTDIKVVKELCRKKNEGITYQKHMTHHILDNNLNWIDPLCNCFLIRNPKSVVSSFMKSWEEGEFEDIGFSQQYSIFKYVINNLNTNPIVIDASKLRDNPKKILSKICKTLNIKWDDNMLEWSSGLKAYDGVWAEHWYPSVMNSTQFKKEKLKEFNLSKDEKKIVDKAMPIYEELYEYCI